MHDELDSPYNRELFSEFENHKNHGISYPNRLRKNVMMVRIFNGYLCETKDEAADKLMQV